MPPPPPSSSSPWHLTYPKLRFFTRIRRFLQYSKTNPKGPKPSDGVNQVVNVVAEEEEDSSVCLLQKAVKMLHFGGPTEKDMAAMEILKLSKEDVKVKKVMAELGVIDPLVAMAESEVVGRRLTAVTALLELASGTYTNKSLMVEAGILEKFPKNIDDEATRHGFSHLMLSLSSLNNSHVPLSHLLPFALSVLDSDSKPETTEAILAALFNFSTVLDTAANLGSNTAMVDSLFRVVSSSKPRSEKALATLGNIVVTSPGKKTIENSVAVPDCLIEALTWDEFPKVQELSAYVLMVLAHQSSDQRTKMAAAGIVPVLVEVSLLGSALAQKRAVKLLQWFKDERQMSVRSHSGPQARRLPVGSPLRDRREGEERNKRVMQRLVKDSLKKNMEMITQRANYDVDDSSSSKLKCFVISTSSKSLPY